MKAAKSSTSVTQNYDAPNREALLLIAAGIHSVSRLALAITGNDVSGMSDELIIDLESRMEEADIEKFLTQCVTIIEKSNQHMLSAIIERGRSPHNI